VREIEKEDTIWRKKARRDDRAAEKRKAVVQQRKEEREARSKQTKESGDQAQPSQSIPKRVFV
jgi:hypothetical protein